MPLQRPSFSFPWSFLLCGFPFQPWYLVNLFQFFLELLLLTRFLGEPCFRLQFDRASLSLPLRKHAINPSWLPVTFFVFLPFFSFPFPLYAPFILGRGSFSRVDFFLLYCCSVPRVFNSFFSIKPSVSFPICYLHPSIFSTLFPLFSQGETFFIWSLGRAPLRCFAPPALFLPVSVVSG